MRWQTSAAKTTWIRVQKERWESDINRERKLWFVLSYGKVCLQYSIFCIQNRTPLPLTSMILNKLYKLFWRSSKDRSDILFSYLKFEIVRWLEKIEISGKMLLQDSPISSKSKYILGKWERLLNISPFLWKNSFSF